jgi:uncharacterized protein (DUF3084 family)
MFWTILALSLTVLMGGLIAYNGDLIGRKFGKRRLSLFGLRPKHTAILITSITGVLISAGTTAVLFLLVPPVREVILSGEDALRLNVILRKDNSNLERTSNILKNQVNSARIQTQSAEQKLLLVRSRYENALLSYKQVTKQLHLAEVSIKRAKLAEKMALEQMKHEQIRTKQLVAYNRELRSRNALMAEANKALADQNLTLAKQNETLTSSNKNLKEENDKENKKNAEYTRANNDLATQNEALMRQNDSLSHANDALLRVNKELINTGDQLKANNINLGDLNSKLQEQNQGLLSDNKRLEDLVKQFAPGYHSLEEAYRALRNRHVAILGGEDLGREVVPANASPDVVRQIIHDLMQNASAYAITKGATPGDNNSAVQVVDKQFFARASTGAYIPIQVTAQERIDAIVNRLSWQPIPYCVIALAVANSVDQEPAAIDFQPFPNRLIYPKGYLVATKKLNSTEPSDKLFNDIVTFLRDMGREALGKGMIPRIDPLTGDPQVGSLGAADIVQLVSRVKDAGGRVKVSAIAANDINAADPLVLHFKVESIL